MDVRESFAVLLDEFTTATGLALTRDGQDGATLELGETIVNLQLLPESEQLLAWATLGFLGDDANADVRLAHLLRLNDRMGANGGFVFSFDTGDQDRVLVHDVRPLGFFEKADVLAAWIEALLDLVETTRVKLDAECPYVDDDELDRVFKEVR